jgi:hypothetical protein
VHHRPDNGGAGPGIDLCFFTCFTFDNDEYKLCEQNYVCIAMFAKLGEQTVQAKTERITL